MSTVTAIHAQEAQSAKAAALDEMIQAIRLDMCCCNESMEGMMDDEYTRLENEVRFVARTTGEPQFIVMDYGGLVRGAERVGDLDKVYAKLIVQYDPDGTRTVIYKGP